MLTETSFQIINMYYMGFRVTVTLATRGVVWIRCGFWKNSKDLLEYLQSRSLSSCNSIKTFDFSTLYTAIPHSKLKDKFRELVQLCFIKRMANIDTNTLY
jgi:endonuclease III-like uncharacterized protein